MVACKLAFLRAASEQTAPSRSALHSSPFTAVQPRTVHLTRRCRLFWTRPLPRHCGQRRWMSCRRVEGADAGRSASFESSSMAKQSPKQAGGAPTVCSRAPEGRQAPLGGSLSTGSRRVLPQSFLRSPSQARQHTHDALAKLKGGDRKGDDASDGPRPNFPAHLHGAGRVGRRSSSGSSSGCGCAVQHRCCCRLQLGSAGCCYRDHGGCCCSRAQQGRMAGCRRRLLPPLLPAAAGRASRAGLHCIAR